MTLVSCLKIQKWFKRIFIPVQNLLWGQSAAPPSGTRSDWLWKRVLKDDYVRLFLISDEVLGFAVP